MINELFQKLGVNEAVYQGNDLTITSPINGEVIDTVDLHTSTDADTMITQAEKASGGSVFGSERILEEQYPSIMKWALHSTMQDSTYTLSYRVLGYTTVLFYPHAQ